MWAAPCGPTPAAGRLCGTGCWRGHAHKCPKVSKICTLLLGTGQGHGAGAANSGSTARVGRGRARHVAGCADSTRGWRWESCAHTWLPADNALPPPLPAGCCAPQMVWGSDGDVVGVSTSRLHRGATALGCGCCWSVVPHGDLVPFTSVWTWSLGALCLALCRRLDVWGSLLLATHPWQIKMDFDLIWT